MLTSTQYQLNSELIKDPRQAKGPNENLVCQTRACLLQEVSLAEHSFVVFFVTIYLLLTVSTVDFPIVLDIIWQKE